MYICGVMMLTDNLNFVRYLKLFDRYKYMDIITSYSLLANYLLSYKLAL